MSDADPSGDLRLNSIARFQKRSDELVLEEHGSCEVPAGCGGVVLRWVKRGQQQAGVSFMLETNGPRRAWVDGKVMENASVWLGVGEHVLTLELTGSDPAHACLVQGFARVRAPLGLTDGLRTRADGSWLATLREPIDAAWQRPGSDLDGTWAPLTVQPWSLPRRDYLGEWLQREGAEPLGLASVPSGPVWIRTAFHLVLERRAGSDA